MSLTQRLQQKQSQQLVITPQLAQSIKLLQLSHAELNEFVLEEVEKNPLLEISSGADEQTSREDSAPGTTEAPETDGFDIEQSSPNTADLISSGTTEAENRIDASFDNVFDTGTAGAEKEIGGQGKETAPISTGSGRQSGSDEDYDFLSNMGETEDLAESLERQIALEFASLEERNIATYIAHGLNEDGYYTDSLEETAHNNGTALETVQRVLARFQTFEPVGVGARNLAECLALQLRDQNRYDPAMQSLVENLEKLARREFAELMQICAVDRDDFVEMVNEIKSLDPRPARSFEPILAETVIPDVIVAANSDGTWRIDLNPDTLPRVLIDRDYHVELSRALDDAESLKFISDCFESANWLVRALDQRAQTILKVAAEIVKQQDAFFVQGRESMKPLTLKTVADAIKMHESTVSRVTSSKYLTCDQGTFELKYFFSSAVSSVEGDDQVSAEAVKYQIRKMVDAESKDAILSDEQIVKSLQEIGIEISRRTVAKYRDAMKISSSVQRRRDKSALL